MRMGTSLRFRFGIVSPCYLLLIFLLLLLVCFIVICFFQALSHTSEVCFLDMKFMSDNDQKGCFTSPMIKKKKHTARKSRSATETIYVMHSNLLFWVAQKWNLRVIIEWLFFSLYSSLLCVLLRFGIFMENIYVLHAICMLSARANFN